MLMYRALRKMRHGEDLLQAGDLLTNTDALRFTHKTFALLERSGYIEKVFVPDEEETHAQHGERPEGVNNAAQAQ